MSLAIYKSKRNFAQTKEPGAGGRRRVRRHGAPGFVIQKHAAKRMHYDFRLQADGVLKSWAVPKGIPTRRGDKRLAMQVEDHPLAYGGFEGIIPAGNYGAGAVMLWDKGTFETTEDDPHTGLIRGKLALRLNGKKLKGHWTLVRMRHSPEKDRHENAWLLIKTEEDVRDLSTRADDVSVQSGRTMKQIAAQSKRRWKSAPAASSGGLKNRVRQIVERAASRRSAA
jgi:bifunctional non-homologous end joining protein LigD